MLKRQPYSEIDLQSVLSKAGRDIANGRLDEAESRYRLALEHAPSDPQLHLTLGLLLLEQGRITAAISEIETSIRLNPMNPNAYRGLGDVLDVDGQWDLAISAYQKACGLDPAHNDALLNLGNVYQKTDRFEAALETYRRLLKIRPGHPRALNNIGKTYHDMGQFKRAEHYYSLALDQQPEYAEAHFNRSVLRITQGDYARGWIEYEWRFKRKSRHKIYPHLLHSPRWDGREYRGKRLLVHCEQGLGDVLQFARYFDMVKQRGGHLIVEAHPPLIPLLAELSCVDELIPFDARRPTSVRHDLHAPLLSLPAIFDTTIDTIPRSFPYLYPAQSRCVRWEHRLAQDGLRIGLVWGASSVNPKRNIALSDCMPFLQIPGLSYYSLQMGPAVDDLNTLGRGISIRNMGGQLRDFADTAALLANLDLMVCVDTAVAHLAGAMDKPLWVMLPHASDWRWPPQLLHSPWYPAARLFRQSTRNNWDDVVGHITSSLHRWQRAQTGICASHAPAARNKADTPVETSLSGDARPLGLRKKISAAAPSFHPPAKPARLQVHDCPPVRMSRGRIRKILFVSPIYGGSLEVMRYLFTGFQQTGRTTCFLDNSSFYPVYRQISTSPESDQEKQICINRMLAASDERLLSYAAQLKPDLIMAIAQSPLDLRTLQVLKGKGIVCAYWFVEDYRFKTYWSQIAPAYDFFFTIQRDNHLKAQFAGMGYANWHYLPLACEPSRHRPWTAAAEVRRAYECDIGFMGAPYRNRLKIFDQLTDYDLKIWGEGWSDYPLSPELAACVQEGRKRISAGETVKIYSSAQIQINLHSSPFDSGISADGEFVNPRTFEIAGCRGFQLADYRCELPHLFEPEKEIILFHNLDELRSLIDYWLPRDRGRADIAYRAQKRAYAQHTYRHRADTILQTIESA